MVAELVYAYASEAYLARVESSNLSVPTKLWIKLKKKELAIDTKKLLI